MSTASLAIRSLREFRNSFQEKSSKWTNLTVWINPDPIRDVQSFMDTIALLFAACLFGGMTFFSFGFAPVLFKLLPVSEVRPLLRGTFPFYYLAVIIVTLIGTVLAFNASIFAASLLALIFISTVAARQVLMPAINRATDAGNKKQFGYLHGLSVLIQLIQIVLCGWAVLILASAI